jgi:class 3 adenylate cyclase
VDIPDVHYVRAGGVAIAYQVVGDGPRTLVFSPQLSDLYTLWMSPLSRPFLDRLASELRLVVFNPRGTGFSDRPRNVTLEARMDDITSILEVIGSPQANLMGSSTSANVCALFAATYPERCERLVLSHPYPRGVRSDEHPQRWDEDAWLAFMRDIRDRWGEREFLEYYTRQVDPTLAASPDALEWQVWQLRMAVSPSAAADWVRMAMETDITNVLGSIRAPTLVIHGHDDRDEARTVCGQIRDSRAMEVRGTFDEERAEAVVEFVRGAIAPRVPDSVLATVLFTDLVGSTERAAELGDRGWRELLEAHHRAVRREVVRFRGVEVDSAGDGFFCRFDGPARAVACARAIVDGSRELELEVRAGIHTGECEVIGDKIAGIAVATGARISSLAAPFEVLVSSTVKDLVAGSGFSFEERGEHDLKGVPGTWRLYAIV